MIYDFGNATKNTIGNKKLHYIRNFKDYMRIICAFMNKPWGWGDYIDLPSSKFTRSMLDIKDTLMKYLSGNFNNHDNMIDAMINDIFLSHTNDVMIITKPDNIINKTPFYISTI